MKYDAIIIGAGQAGPTLAGFFTNEGQKVALAEGAQFGGSCVNYGCTPTKTMRASARVAYQAKRSADYGINVGDVEVDFGNVMARKDRVVGNSRQSLIDWLESLDNLTLYRDFASFVGYENDLFQVKIGDEIHEAARVYLNVGTRAFVPPIEGLGDVDFLDNVKLMSLQQLPQHMIILGGSYIGLEMGQIFRRLGSAVTIIETSDHLASREDEDVSEEIERIFKEEGIDIFTGYKAVHASQNNEEITILVENKDGQQQEITGSHLLVATGRIPNTDSLNLDAIGVETNKRGYVITDDKLESSMPNLWAVGDVNGRGAFTHTSYHDAELVRDNWQGANRRVETRNMAYSMFTDPPLGRVGMSESDARQYMADTGRKVLGMRYYMKDVSRAKEDGELNGLVKLFVDAESEEFLGACVFGMQGDDVIQVVSNYMATGASYKIMQKALPIHPTISEYFSTWLGMLEELK